MTDKKQQTVVNVNLAATTPATPVKPKSVGIAFALWLFFGGIGAHRFYLGQKHAKTILFLAIGVVLLFVVYIGIAMIIGEVLLSIAYIGILMILFVLLWVLVDAFSLSEWVNEYNSKIVSNSSKQELVTSSSQTEKEMPSDLKILLLKEAETRGGILTVTQGVLATGKTFEEIEKCLQGMLASGYVDIDNRHNGGLVVYRFLEMINES